MNMNSDMRPVLLANRLVTFYFEIQQQLETKSIVQPTRTMHTGKI